MQTISDARLLLQDAEKLYREIEVIHNTYCHQESIPPNIKLKIKQFLENIDSALGYEAFNIFSKYCTVPPDKLEQHESKLYFPVRNSKKSYDQFIERWYPGLKEANPTIVAKIEKYQPFPNQPTWLSRLKHLVNKNKHRNLTKQTKRQNMYIRNFEDFMGNKIINCTFENVGSAMSINGKTIDVSKPNPFVKNFTGR
jgi:hypothetical protein